MVMRKVQDTLFKTMVMIIGMSQTYLTRCTPADISSESYSARQSPVRNLPETKQQNIARNVPDDKNVLGILKA